LNELNDRFRAIADGSALGATVNAEGRSFKRCRFQEHLIFFEETSNAVEIVRVLHPGMNIAAQLNES
jgi:plasmid stabilization system protein ParE